MGIVFITPDQECAVAVMNEQLVGVDCLAAPEIAGKVLDVGVKKARMAFRPMFTLALLAGAYIGLGAMFATVAGAGGAALPFGVYRVLFGFVFCLGLILVVVAGAELFTGNTLITMAWASGRLGVGLLLRNWTIVWIGNLIGSLIMALLVFLAGNYLMGNGQVGQLALSVANTKAGIGFGHPLQHAGLPRRLDGLRGASLGG